jgi:hydrophobic/amphiphilic exporter-1 (mainly G- bacteria), HAE1 family
VILSDVAIRRPVFTTMVVMALVVFGLVGLRSLGIDLFPRVEFPVITIITELRGADPETIETTVTDPIEEAVSTISAIKSLRSTSAEGFSQVIIEFELEKDVDVAYQEVQSKLGAVRGELPTDAEDPVVEKFDVDSSPIMAVVVSADLPPRDLADLADDVIKERLQRVKNVGQVRLVGARQRKVWLWLDRAKLEGHGLAVQDVERALRAEHIEFPGGRVETGPLEYVVKTRAEFESAADFDQMVVAYRGGAPVRVRDLGHAEDGLEERRSAARHDGRPAIALLVRRQSGTNTVQVAQAVKAELERLREELAPRGVRLAIAQDLSVYIEHSIHEIQFHLVMGGALAVLIVFVFLRDWRITLISACAIPTSVISTFILMNALGFTLNMMTMLALSLSIGLLIDDAIVVVENIFRHVEEGQPALAAAHGGTAEIGLAVMAITASVVAVFLPVAFMKGIVGRFFFQFGMTVTFAVIISLFVALTLIPMLAARLLKAGHGHGRLFLLIGRGLDALDAGYSRLLRAALRRRFVTIGLAIATFIGAMALGRFIRAEFIPLEDQSEFNVRVKAPLGASLETTDRILERLRGLVQGQPWVEYTFATIGSDELRRVNEGVMYVKMVPKDARALGQVQAMQWVREQVKGIADARVGVEIVPRVSGGGRKNADIQLEVRGPDLDVLERVADAVRDHMRETPGFADPDTTFDRNKPEVSVSIKRDRAADLGVDPLAVATTVRALIGGADVAKLRSGGDRFDVAVRLQEPFRDRPGDIELLTVRNDRGELVRLSNVARVEVRGGPVQIDRYARTRQITVTANLRRETKVLGEAVGELNALVTKLGLPPGYSFGFAGQADTMKEAFANLLFALFLAVVIIYMVLASQFESFMHPLTIMLSLPLSLVGALGALVATGMTLNIYTMIGIIMLMGLVTKNAILLVDFANHLRQKDGPDTRVGREGALLEAGETRLRPILMTTLAMIFGMLPIALGTGAGSESRAPMAIAVIGGLTTSTLLTLVVVPAVYTVMDDLSRPAEWRLVRWLRSRRG